MVGARPKYSNYRDCLFATSNYGNVRVAQRDGKALSVAGGDVCFRHAKRTANSDHIGLCLTGYGPVLELEHQNPLF